MIAIRVAVVRHTVRTGRVVALAAALLLMSSCALFGGRAKDPDPRLAEPMESTARTDDDRAAAGDAALSSAREAWQDGDALSVIAITTRALREGVPESYEAPLRALRTQARSSLLDHQVARLSVLPAQDAVTGGAEIRGTVHIQNLSSAPLGIPATTDGSSTSQIVLDVVREDWDIYGNVRTTEFSERIPLEQDILVAPGGVVDVPVSVPADRARLLHTGFTVLRIGGRLRAVVIRVGATEFFDALELTPCNVRVFMDGWERLAAEPYSALELSVQKRSPPHLLTAVELLAPGERRSAVELLTKAIEDDPPLAFVCRAAVARLNRLLTSASDGP